MNTDTSESEDCANGYSESLPSVLGVESTASTRTQPKKKRRICCFRDEWLNDPEFKLWIARDSHDPSMVRCKSCCSSFSVKAEGVAAVRKHACGDKHKRNSHSQKMSETLNNFFSNPHSAEKDQITASELALTYHGVQHQHSYLSQDCGTKLACRVFSDSKISKKITCGRTKAEALVENVLGPHSVELVLKELKEGSKPYSISTDASNKGNLKMYPVSIRFFSYENGVTDRLIDFYEDFDETSDGISRKLLQVLDENGLETKNLVSYGADNASVNYGKHHSVFVSLKAKQPHLMKANCNCHVLHNAAKHACKQLPYDVESLVIKVYNEFSSSAKRLEELKKCYEFVGEEFSVLLRHVPIRWLSLAPAIARLVECWKAVKTYFIAEGEEETNKLIWKFVKDQANGLLDDGVLSLPECYIHFVLNFMKIFTRAIEKLESETTYITQVYDILDGLRNELTTRVSDQFFGFSVNNNFQHLAPNQIQCFKKDALNVYTRALAYLNQWFNFENNVLQKIQILSLDEVFSFDSLLELVSTLGITVSGDDLYKEYCILRNVLPKLQTKSKIDERWVQYFKNCDAPNFQKIVGYVLAIPISNAHVERIFSLMKNLWTDERNRMRPELVKAELCVKVNFDQSCGDFLHYVGGQKCLLKDLIDLRISRMESRSLAEGGPRVKFSLTRRGTISDYFNGSSASSEFCTAASQLADALTILTETGATPILPDGKLAGNGAVRIATGDQEFHLLVSKSGKTVGEKIDLETDTCIVTRFSPETWSAEYYSSSKSVLPTSDTPLHYCILRAYKQFAWSEVPMATLHGHSLDSLEDAERLQLPCSQEETMFSTPDDLRALLDLAGRHPYPQNKIFIRRGHGFFILGKDVPDALQTFRRVVEPYLKAKKTS